VAKATQIRSESRISRLGCKIATRPATGSDIVCYHNTPEAIALAPASRRVQTFSAARERQDA
jgi:hypothetical protein